MYGNNPIRPPVKGDGTALDIQEIFKTFQGEGPYVGWPAIFIRLGGCNLACEFCDTEFESFTNLSLDDILLQTDTLSGRTNDAFTHQLVVISGGEPFRQPIEHLCNELLDRNYNVQIETNGTLFRTLDTRVDIVCSPKNTGNGYHRIREDLLPHINAFKFIISANNPQYQAVADVGQNDHPIPVYVQPMDEYDERKNQDNLQHTLALVSQHGYLLSLQTHKIVGAP